MSLSLAEIFPVGETYVEIFVESVLRQFNDAKVDRLIRSVPVANDNTPKPRFEVTWYEDIDETRVKSFVIDEAFGEKEFSVVVGKPGSGKSAIITDAACHVAAGREWHGRTVQQGLVVYFAAERKQLTERRMAAFRKVHGVRQIPLAVVGGKLDMTSGLIDARALAQVVLELEKTSGSPCVWIILDTLSRTFGGGDQNATKDMGKYVQAVDELLRRTRAAVTVIHHTTWNEARGKGAIDLDGAVDTSFLVSKTGSAYQLKCDSANDGIEGPIATFKLDSVTLAVDANGKETTAPVVVPTQANLAGMYSDEPVKAKLSKANADALATLHKAVANQGELPPVGTMAVPDTKMVTRDVWREEFISSSPLERVSASRAFLRTTEKLRKLGVISNYGQWFCPSDNRT